MIRIKLWLSASLVTALLVGCASKLAEQPPLRKMYINSRVSNPIYRSYLEGWQKKVEKVGNAPYPKELREKGVTGSLLLSVDIMADGSLANIEIKRSSEHHALNEAAKRIVTQAAPFAPLPPEILKDFDILNITTTWRFAQQSGPKME